MWTFWQASVCLPGRRFASSRAKQIVIKVTSKAAVNFETRASNHTIRTCACRANAAQPSHCQLHADTHTHTAARTAPMPDQTWLRTVLTLRNCKRARSNPKQENTAKRDHHESDCKPAGRQSLATAPCKMQAGVPTTRHEKRNAAAPDNTDEDGTRRQRRV